MPAEKIVLVILQNFAACWPSTTVSSTFGTNDTGSSCEGGVYEGHGRLSTGYSFVYWLLLLPAPIELRLKEYATGALGVPAQLHTKAQFKVHL